MTTSQMKPNMTEPQVKDTHDHTSVLTMMTASMAAVIALAACSPQKPPSPPDPLVYVSTVRNVATDAQRILSGSVRPRIESELAFRTGGRVTERLVEVGQTVRAGQVLARLDTSDLQLALQAASDQLRAAEVDAAQSASDAGRFQRLRGEGSVGAADTERQQARADAAEARRQQAQAQRELVQNRLGYAQLTAPFGGVVTALRVEAGQTVAEGQSIVGIAKPGELEVQVDVPEDLVGSLKEWRAEALIGSSQSPADELQVARAMPMALRLRELAPSAQPVSRTTRARYALASPAQHQMLRMGSTAEVRLHRPGTAAGAELPVGAMLTTPEGTSVWTVDANTGALTRRTVQLLSQTTAHVRVGGLPDGALVVSAGAQKLDAGLKVRPVARPLADPLASVVAR